MERARGAAGDPMTPSCRMRGPTRPPAAQVLRAPPDVSKLVCFQCGEEIPIFFDDSKQEWMLRDAVYAKDGSGRICHSGCAGP